MVLLKCVDRHETNMLQHEVHEGSVGTHANGYSMAKKMLRAGYYWLTMESDCYKFSKKCHKCQIYADKIHVPPTLLNIISSPWPFSMWGIDMIGMIEPKASNNSLSQAGRRVRVLRGGKLPEYSGDKLTAWGRWTPTFLGNWMGLSWGVLNCWGK